jgi:hypothetical protein
MAIRVAPRASISDAFKQAIVEISAERLKAIKEDLEYRPKDQFLRKNMAPIIVRLGKLVNPATRADAMDEIMTRLRGLSYTAFDVEEIAYSSGREFWDEQQLKYVSKPAEVARHLVGVTQDVIISSHGKWNMGPYKAMIPFSKLIKSKQQGDWQFIPVSQPPDYYYRHPHHHAGYGSTWMHSATCWGGFNQIIPSLCKMADVPELFRTIYIYLGRYDGSSVLTAHLSQGNFPFARAQ